MSVLSFADVKIHNEIEFCKITDSSFRKTIEKAFLENSISYYEKWDEPTFLEKIFGIKSEISCTICINLLQQDKAERVFNEIPGAKEHAELILRKVDKMFF